MNQWPACGNRCGDSVMVLNEKLRCVTQSGFASTQAPRSPCGLRATPMRVAAVSLAGLAV